MHLQHKGDQQDMVCDKFEVAEDIDNLKGQWLDFVMHARWTGGADGFFKLWMRPENGEPQVRVDYHGRTWWDDEDKGPYFKMGAYMGEPGWDGPESRTVYTDEYRLGDERAALEDVAPWMVSNRP